MERVFQEAKNQGWSEEDAERIAHRANLDYLIWFKLSERGAQAALGGIGPIGIGAGMALGELAEWKYEDCVKDYFMNKAIEDYKIDKENWQNFRAPDSSTYYGRTR